MHICFVLCILQGHRLLKPDWLWSGKSKLLPTVLNKIEALSGALGLSEAIAMLEAR